MPLERVYSLFLTPGLNRAEAEAPEVKVVEDPPPMQMMAAPTPAPAPVFAAPPPQPMQQMPGANIGVV